jgi:tRNA threonylcarbamoyladenosine biosynthesis protein TsaE
MKYSNEITYSLDDHQIVIQELKKLMPHFKVFACSGPLGAGKTTTIKALLRSCGVTGVITSPTFTYVNEYTNGQSEHFYHFDLYRIGSVQEFQGQGFDEYLYQPGLRSSLSAPSTELRINAALCEGGSKVGPNSWAFIEWPEVIKPLLTHDVCWVTFDYHEDPDKRVIKIECK